MNTDKRPDFDAAAAGISIAAASILSARIVEAEPAGTTDPKTKELAVQIDVSLPKALHIKDDELAKLCKDFEGSLVTSLKRANPKSIYVYKVHATYKLHTSEK